MNEECKCCETFGTCLKDAEYGSLYCQLHKRIPKVVEKTYEELSQENKKYKEVFNKIKEYINGAYEMATYTKSVSLDEENIEDILDILKEVE